jgi:hypothetical protein
MRRGCSPSASASPAIALKPVTFDMTLWSYEPTALRATARLTINRMLWGVAFRGSRLTNDLVDDDVQLELDITARGNAS